MAHTSIHLVPRSSGKKRCSCLEAKDQSSKTADLLLQLKKGRLGLCKERERVSACVRAWVCVCVSHPVSNDLKLQGDWSRFAYSVQRSYGISVEEWSDQPLVPACDGSIFSSGPCL